MQQTLSDYLQQHVADTRLQQLILTITHIGYDISQQITLGGLANILGATEQENVQGEVQKKLDIIANTLLLEQLSQSGLMRAIASEELEDIVVAPNCAHNAPYLVLFDPLDGSSNIDINMSIGTIFSILPTTSTHPTEADFLQPGRQQLVAGYILYGPQTMLVLTVGQGTVGFTLEPQKATWHMTHDNYHIPLETAEFAINMSNMRHWDPAIHRYISDCLAGTTGPLGKDYNMRWVAAMVADVHRILNRGGLFSYPWDKRQPQRAGKLRLMYEANPMSFLVEQANGKSSNGNQDILDIQPTSIHERVSVILGSAQEVERLLGYIQARS